MPVRRAADPIKVQHVWDGIRSANAQRQVADISRIVKYVQRVASCSQAQAELYVKQTLRDGLIIAIQKLGSKGSKVGVQVESYKIPVQEFVEIVGDGKDWYCIECHCAGDVTTCSKCPRVYHLECVRQKDIDHKNDESNKKPDQSQQNLPNVEQIFEKIENSQEITINGKESSVDIYKENSIILIEEDINCKSSSNPNINNCKSENKLIQCSICNYFEEDEDVKLDKQELNYLLTFIHNRIKSWLPYSITDTLTPEDKHEWLTSTELSWRAQQLFYKQIDMSVMELKLRTQEYTRICEFQADVLTVHHNVAIFHGIESQEFGAAELMLRDCLYDISELKNCVDCYRHSNEKINSKWFCLPCRAPHNLVWAKQKGYPYWPAKVIKESEDIFDVRFFGGKYERAVLSRVNVKPITTSIKSLQVKRTAAFNKSVEELTLHQKLLENPNDATKLLAAKPKKKVPQKTRKSLPVNGTGSAIFLNKRKNKSLDLKDIYEFHDSPKEKDNNFTVSEQRGVKRKTIENISPKSKQPSEPVGLKTSSPKRITSSKSSETKRASDELINISSDFDDDFSILTDDYQIGYDGGHQEVSSSTEHKIHDTSSQDTTDGLFHASDRKLRIRAAIEKTKQKLEQCKDRQKIIKVAIECMQTEINKVTNEHDEYLKKVFEAHNTQISDTKKKQWCYNCEQDAIYHCCWNTAYCSPTCQQQHWQAEHKKVCRRKR